MSTMTPTSAATPHDPPLSGVQPIDERQPTLRSPLRIDSVRLPSTPLIRFLRWWLPAIVCLVGVAIAIVTHFDTDGVDALAVFGGAGSSIWLMNFLWRLGISGEEDRDREAAARTFYDTHGYWPDEPSPER